MPTLANNDNVTLTLTDYDSVTISTLGVAVVSAVSGLGVAAGKIGEFSGSRTLGPFAAGSLSIAASVRPCHYEVADGVRPVEQSGAGAVAAITGSYVVGQTLTATFPAGITGTIQFTRTLAAAPFTKTAISGAVASAVSSLTYTVQSADTGYVLGVDCTTVQAGVGGLIAATGGPVRAAALRNTSTGFKLADMVSGSNNVMGARSEHTARERLTAPQLLYGNWYATTNNEISGTGVMQFLGVSIEYPEGVFTPVKFGGATTYDLAAGAEVVSDPVTIDIPEGAMYWVRQRVTWPTGKNLYVGAGITTGRTQFQASASLASVPDYVMGGGNWSVVAVGNNNSFSPIAVLQVSTRVSIGIYGSSTPTGTGDSGSVAGALALAGGYISRAFAPVYAVSNIALAGDHIEGFLSHCAKRVALSQYLSDIIISNGMNDIYVTGRTAAATITRYNTLIQQFTSLGKKVYTCLHQPRNGGVWTSDAGQVIDATKEGYRLELQAAIKAGLTGASGYIDALAASETVTNPESGLWISSPVSTTDGIHMNAPTHALAATLVDVGIIK